MNSRTTSKQDLNLQANADRARILLQATRDILHKADAGPYVQDVFALTAFWDGEECDGLCLLAEIEEWLSENAIESNQEVTAS